MAFIEVLSPCPTQFGRRNHIDDLQLLYKQLTDLCLDQAQERSLSPAERTGRPIIGEFFDE
jgi:2-oxoglutarate ferredoxin oxidoreductase subunit beta